MLAGAGQDVGLGGTGVGYANVYSGATGQILRQFFGGPGDTELGASAAGIGDINADGVPEVLVGAPGDGPNGPDAGSAVVYDGATGAPLAWHLGNDAFDRYGTSVAAAGDLDGDGHLDYLIGDRGHLGGTVQARSGFDFSVLKLLGGGPTYGASVDGAGDVDADGFADLVIGAFGADSFRGEVTVRSGKNFWLLQEYRGQVFGQDHLGRSVAGVGDIDGDGFAEIAVGAAAIDGTGFVRVYSGQSGSAMFTVAGTQPSDEFGAVVAAAGDVDADGRPDVLVGAPNADSALSGAGAQVTFELREAFGVNEATSAILLFGTGKAHLPVAGGCILLVSPVLAAMPLSGVGYGEGEVTISTVVPSGVPSGLVTVQALCDDPFVPSQFTLTNGIELHLP